MEQHICYRTAAALQHALEHCRTAVPAMLGDYFEVKEEGGAPCCVVCSRLPEAHCGLSLQRLQRAILVASGETPAAEDDAADGGAEHLVFNPADEIPEPFAEHGIDPDVDDRWRCRGCGGRLDQHEDELLPGVHGLHGVGGPASGGNAVITPGRVRRAKAATDSDNAGDGEGGGDDCGDGQDSEDEDEDWDDAGGDMEALQAEQAALCAASPDNAPCTLSVAEATALIDSVLRCGGDERFVDDAFPATDRSINRTVEDDHPGQFIKGQTEWRRAWEAFDTPRLFVDGVNVHDVCQGGLGNCYMVSQIASAGGMHPSSVQALFHPQAANPQGIYGVRLWVEPMAEWRMVIVDDKVPCHPGTASLRFVRSSTDGELWPTLLEKALAKVHSSYQDLSAGLGCISAAQAMLGGRTLIVCPEGPQATWAAIVHCLDRRWPVRTSTGATDEEGNFVAVGREEGLVDGHAYSILRYHHHRPKGIRLLQLRNPWGGTEWGGDWSDGSPKWAQFPQVAKAVGHEAAKDDGLFWISVRDFCKRFGGLHVYGVQDEALLPEGASVGQGDWLVKRRAAKADLEAHKTTVVCSDAGGPDGGTDVFAGPQYTLTIPAGGAVIRAKAERVSAEASPVETSGGAATFNLFDGAQGRASGAAAGRVLCVGGAYQDAEAPSVVSSMFLTDDVPLAEGRYTIVPFVCNAAPWPVEILLKSSVEVGLAKDPDVGEVACGVSSSAETAAGEEAVFTLTAAVQGRHVLEATTAAFDSFSHWQAMLTVTVEKDGEELEYLAKNGTTRVAGVLDLEPGEHTVRVRHDAFSGPLTLRACALDGDGDAPTVELQP